MTLGIGSHEITLWATDGVEWAAAAPITVTVSDVPATANAGGDQTLAAAGALTTVTLDGSGSANAVTFAWSVDGAWVSDAAVATVGLAPGVHEASLTVTSVGGVESTDTATITVNPTADAGEDQTADATSDAGAAVDLSGSGFGETFTWTEGETVLGTGADLSDVTFAIGVHEVTLTVTAPGGLSASDTVIITVDPVAVAGDDQTVDATDADGAEVTLDGTGSFGDVSWLLNGTEIAEGVSPDPVLLPIGVNEITLVAAGGEGQDPATDTVTVTVNPVANAGDDQTVSIDSAEGANVTLDGTGSAADPATFVWSLDDEEIATGATPTVVLPVGTHEITLTVGGPDELSDSDTVTIVVEGPVANANATQREWDATSADGADVTLDGSLSSDTAELYAWWTNCPADAQLPCDEADRLTPDSADNEVVEVPLAIGEHQITLWVQDGDVWYASPTITVTVNPVANAGEDQVVESTNGTDAEVTLDGSASIGDLSTIVWTHNDGDGDEELGTGAELDVTLPVGTHEIEMTISGPDGVSATDTVTIVVAVAPTADAGEDQTLKATSDDGAEVTLDGSGSEAAGDAEIVAWKWTTEENPIGVTGETATMELPIGTTTVTLTVVDSNGLTATDTVDITITVPVADAGEDQTVTATSGDGAEVTLDGSGSIGDITEYVWSTDEDDELATGETATVTLPLGTHEITLTVTDADDNTDSDTVTIVVEAPEGDPSASITPARGTVNSWIDYELELFPADETVTIELVRAGSAPIALGTVDTDAIGSASGSVRVPATPGGNVEIRFTSGDVVDSAAFEVAPRIKVIPDTVAPGDTVDISLRGFAKQESVLIRWRIGGIWVPVTTITTSNTGSANAIVTVPANVTGGQNSVRADGSEFRAQTNAVTVVAPVVPAATLSPTRGTVNTWVDYSITGFPANSDVAITWKRPGGSTVTVGVAETDASGAATGRIRVPATTGGSANLVIFSSGTTVVTANYEVAPRIKVIPGTVEAGQTVDVSLRGFGKNETVRIRWNVGGIWVTVATVTTSNTGSANVTVTVPAFAEAGQNSVRGDGPSFRAQTNAVTVVE